MGMINNNPLAPFQKVAETLTAPVREGVESVLPPIAPSSSAEAQTVFAQNQMLAPIADLATGAQEAFAGPLDAANPADIIENAAGGLPEMLSNGLGSLPGMAQQAIQQVGNVAGMGQNLLAPVTDIANNILGPTGLGDMINNTLGGNATGAVGNITDIAGLLPIGELTEGLSQIPEMVGEAVGKLTQGDVMGAAESVIGNAMEIGQGVIPGMVNILPDLAGSAGNLVGNAAPMVANLADMAGEVLPGILETIAPMADAIGGGEEVVKALGEITGAVTPIISQVANTAGQVAPVVGDSSQSILGAIVPSVNQILGEA